MKKNILILLVIALLISHQSKSQCFTIDTAKLNTAYRELINKPNTIERQRAFFEAFPNTWMEFIMTYRFDPKENYDLTMYDNAYKHVEALGGRVTLIKDSVYCTKIVNIAIGGELEADAPNYYRTLLHRIMWRKMDAMLYAVSQLRKGHQMQFWQFYWSNVVKSKDLEIEYNSLQKLNSEAYPDEMKIMKIAYDYFYDGINFNEGYYLKEEKSPMQKLIEENNIPKQKYEKFWVILERNYITYHPDEKWNVVSDSLSPICTDDKCYIKNVLGLQDGKLSYKDGKCMIAVGAAFKPGKKIPNPYKYEEAREYIFSRVGNYFEWGKKFRSLSNQDLKDVEMLVKDYPAETAQSIFNGKSMFIYPLNFKGEYCQGKYRYGRGVVILGKYNVPLYLYFFMTDESIVDFDKYLSELKGVFWFEDIENV